MITRPTHSATTWQDKLFSVGAWLVWIVVAYFLANLVMAVLLIFLQHYHLIDYNNSNTIAKFMIDLAMYILILLIAVFVPIWWRRRKQQEKIKNQEILEQIGLIRRPKLIDLSYFAANVPVFYVVNFTIAYVAIMLLGPEIMSQNQSLSFSTDGNDWWQLIIIALTFVIIAPLFEEILMRGFLFTKVRKYLSFWPTAVTVSLLFALAHMQINVGIMTFIMSMFCCRIREKTGTIWGGIFLHAFVNAVSFTFLFLV